MNTASMTIPAHFDGQQIRLDEPVQLSINAKLLVTVLPESAADDEAVAWERLALQGLAGAYGVDESAYSLSLIKELNPDYAGG